MTFRPETSPKDSKDSKENSADGANQNQPLTNISTIYSPRLQCTQNFSPVDPIIQQSYFATPFAFNANKVVCNSPKKSLVEKIKKISFKLNSIGRKNKELDDAQKRMRFIKYICLSTLLACKLTMLFFIFVFMYGPVRNPEARNIIVDGEFQILNQNFEFDMVNKDSFSFIKLASNLTSELNRLFRRSDVGECYKRSEVLDITPNMTIKCIVLFHNCDNMNVGRIGLAFLRSLRLQQGHAFLGLHTINVQSIGFQIRGEEGIWGEWSPWSGCESPDDTFATRMRNCLTKHSLEITNVDRCLLNLSKKNDLDFMPCEKYRNLLRQKEEENFANAVLSASNKMKIPIPLSMEEDLETGRL